MGGKGRQWQPTEDGWKRVSIEFRREIYQGDSLSPLLFCLAVSPLSEALREGVGFRSKFHVMPVIQARIEELDQDSTYKYLGVAERARWSPR